jgi:EpsI family protein
MTPRTVACAGLLFAAVVVVQFRSHGEAVSPRKPLDTFAPVIAGWQPAEASMFTDDIRNVLKASDYVMRRYDDAGRSASLFIGYWDSQRKGAQPHSPKNCLPGSGWEPLEMSRIPIPLSAGGTLTVNRFLIQKDQERQLILYWYQAQGKAVAGELQAKLEMVRNSILYNRTDGAIIRVSSPIYGSVAETSARLVQFVQALQPLLSEYLPG